MPHPPAARRNPALALIASLAAALLVGAALARARPFATTTPEATPITTRATAPPAAGTRVMASVGATPATRPPQDTPAAASGPTRTMAARATASPPEASWLEVGRWQNQQLIITEPFSVRGPWRICWALHEARGTFQIMIGDAGQTAWDLRSGPTGAVAGAFDVAQGGNFRLMPHNETPYTVVVWDRPRGDGPVVPPPCGP